MAGARSKAGARRRLRARDRPDKLRYRRPTGGSEMRRRRRELETGTGDLADIWSQAPSGPGRAVMPAVARFTRVCAYDRPGTYLLPDHLSRSDAVAMPRGARDMVLDMRALLFVPARRVILDAIPTIHAGEASPLMAARRPSARPGLTWAPGRLENRAAFPPAPREGRDRCLDASAP
jgi:hypothetical protein